MQVRNNSLFSYKPFGTALLTLAITTGLFIIFGANGWGVPAENEQAIGQISRWCERVSGGFFREPANTLGNLGFVFTGLYMFDLVKGVLWLSAFFTCYTIMHACMYV